MRWRLATSFRARLVLALCGLSFLTAAVVLHAAWRRARATQVANLRSLLEGVAGAVAPSIDGDRHERFLRDRPEERDRAWYAELRALGERVRTSNPRFQDVYTLGDLDGPSPGWGRFVLADAPEEVGRPYDLSRFDAMRRAREGPASDEDLEADEYGRTLSGYAPIRDRAGRTVGLLGIDVDASTVVAMRHHLAYVLALGVGGAAVVSGLVGWFLASKISRPVHALSTAMDRVGSGDLAVRASWRGEDEIGRLAGTFDRMVEGLAEGHRLKQALAIAMEIQQNLLPSGPPSVPGVEVAGFSDYCDETGGDYFDYPRTWAVPGGRLAMTIGDVTGHGIGAALLMSTGRAVLRSHAEREIAPGALLGIVNRHLAHDATPGKFMTLFYAVLDPAAGTLSYANAGQGGCAVLRRDGGWEDLPAGGPPLGVVAGADFPESRVEGLVTGDVVVLTTDGVWETVDAAGEPFDFHRLESVVRAHAGSDAATIAGAIRRAVEDHRGSGAQADDVTVVVAKLVAPRAAS